MKIINKEYSRLYQLLQENKLTKPEFNILVSKINQKTWLDIIISWIFSPYTKLKPSRALILGLGFMLLSSCLAMMSGFHFPGIPASEEVLAPQTKLGFIQILLEHILQWFILSIVFYLIAKANKAKNIRLFDFFAFIAMAFLARVVFGIELLGLKLISPDFFANSSDTRNLLIHYSRVVISIWIIVKWLMYIWLYRLYFASLELASGLTGVRLWTNFVLGLVIAQTICYNLFNYWLH